MPAVKSLHSVKLTFDLTALPTAQHKAGLAGLVLQVRELEERADEFDPEELPLLTDVTAKSATLTLNERSTGRLFDELYSAKVEPVTVKSKWAGQTPLNIEKREEIDPASGKMKSTSYFTYEVVTPRNPFLMRHLDAEVWQKLWRTCSTTFPALNRRRAFLTTTARPVSIARKEPKLGRNCCNLRRREKRTKSARQAFPGRCCWERRM